MNSLLQKTKPLHKDFEILLYLKEMLIGFPLKRPFGKLGIGIQI